MTATVYRAYDEQERLLYVGISYNELLRLGQHTSSSQWAAYVAKITFQRCATRREAEEAEAEAIKSEDPVFNYVGRPSRRFLQWMAAYPHRDPDEVDTEELRARFGRAGTDLSP
ncbi:hypothetical protein [Streptomyces sp. NPDC093261]|uniref:hypothetical protein n=1 Tax=Streptomyces sp. NPDC093261 TaxID=3366037 RepID=UPI00382F65D6